MKETNLKPLTAAALILTTAIVWGGITPTAARAVSTADEICAPTADPCVISSVVEVDHLSILDFGDRTVRITGNGELDIGAGSVVVLCDRFEAVSLSGADQTAIRARGPSLFGSGIDGGSIEIRAQRRCSENMTTGCLNDFGCDFGTCSANMCTGDPDRRCTSDSGCDVGPCILNQATQTRRCGATNLRCTTDADCNFGTCDLGTTFCAGRTDRVCGGDGDCQDGQCLAGLGEVDIDGVIRADGQAPGSVTVLAAGDVHLRQRIRLEAGDSEQDGGVLQIVSRLGDVIIDGKVDAQGGGASQGGDLSMSAGRDLFLNEDINIDGGEFDGGFFDVDAGRDITVRGDILASSINRDGFGGDIALLADRDINVVGPSEWKTNGHEGSENFCGEAGAQEIDAGRNLTIGLGVVMQANGPEPDCGGEEINLTAGNDAVIAGKLEARARGSQGAGGLVELTADESVTFESTAIIDVRGGGDGAGGVDVSASNNLIFDAKVDATASGGGGGDTVALVSGCMLSMGGEIEVGGTVDQGINGMVDLVGGDVVVETGASIINSGGSSINMIRGADQVTIAAGSLVAADATTGLNEISYRIASLPPVIAGVVTPSPTLVLDPTITPGDCVCGDGAGGTVETCDDGNDCTIDSCNPTTGVCDHIVSCDDGIACTVDTCTDDVCENTPDDGLCNDGNLCTDNICAAGTGCVATFNTDPCNDGIGCTEDDVCDRGDCIGVPDCPEGETCDLDRGICLGGAGCGNGSVEPPEQCDDGDVDWVFGEFCNASCTMLRCGDPNDSGSTTATDALFVLSTAVALASCDLCVCNVDNSGVVTATDALRTLQAAVGGAVSLVCPVCM